MLPADDQALSVSGSIGNDRNPINCRAGVAVRNGDASGGGGRNRAREIRINHSAEGHAQRLKLVQPPCRRFGPVVYDFFFQYVFYTVHSHCHRCDTIGPVDAIVHAHARDQTTVVSVTIRSLVIYLANNIVTVFVKNHVIVPAVFPRGL